MTVLVVLLLVLLAGYVVAAREPVRAAARAWCRRRRRRSRWSCGAGATWCPRSSEQVRAYEAHESGVLREVAAAHRAAEQGDDDAEERLTRALRALPPLQTGPVQQLQAQLAETEDRIAAARRFHVANVRALEVRLDTFPSSLVARGLGVERPDDDVLSDLERADLELPPDTR